MIKAKAAMPDVTDLHPTIRHILMPARIRTLPLTENGYPVLFFADSVDEKPDLRVMDGRKLVRCIREKLCWLCGQPLGRNMAFVVGPMCCVTRTTSEPPNHLDCAQYAVIACPFLTRPRAHRRETGLPEDASMAGLGLRRNPGVSAIWSTRNYEVWKPSGGGILMTVGDPERVEWWAEGRQATYAEVAESIESGAPALFEQCDKDRDPEGSREELIKQFSRLLPLFRGLPGREARKPELSGMNEAMLIAVRSDELAWFASHPTETEYIRPVRDGECPSESMPFPTHVRVRKIDEAQRVRAFGVVAGGAFHESAGQP